MKKITAEETLALLKESGVPSVVALDEINHAAKNQKFVAGYCTNDVILYVTRYQKTFMDIIPRRSSVDWKKIGVFIENSHLETDAVKIDMHLLDETERQKAAAAITEKYTLVPEWTLVDYTYIEKEPPNGDDSAEIRFLSPEDKELFTALEQPKADYRPSLEALFNAFVEKGEGYILAWLNGDKIAGYISYKEYVEGIYDVDCLYVSPAYQKRGIGRRLTESYTRRAMAINCLPYYSNARTEASVRTALSVGYVKAFESTSFIRKDLAERK